MCSIHLQLAFMGSEASRGLAHGCLCKHFLYPTSCFPSTSHARGSVPLLSPNILQKPLALLNNLPPQPQLLPGCEQSSTSPTQPPNSWRPARRRDSRTLPPAAATTTCTVALLVTPRSCRCVKVGVPSAISSCTSPALSFLPFSPRLSSPAASLLKAVGGRVRAAGDG